MTQAWKKELNAPRKPHDRPFELGMTVKTLDGTKGKIVDHCTTTNHWTIKVLGQWARIKLSDWDLREANGYGH